MTTQTATPNLDSITVAFIVRGESTLKAAAVRAYRNARDAGFTPEESAAAAAWDVVRRHPEGKHLRAPRWNHAIDANGGNGRRSFRLPLGEILYGDVFSDVGGYCGKWRRTARSYAAVQCAQHDLISRLENAWTDVRTVLA